MIEALVRGTVIHLADADKLNVTGEPVWTIGSPTAARALAEQLLAAADLAEKAANYRSYFR